jgi:hypothetical protein
MVAPSGLIRVGKFPRVNPGLNPGLSILAPSGRKTGAQDLPVVGYAFLALQASREARLRTVWTLGDILSPG